MDSETKSSYLEDSKEKLSDIFDSLLSFQEYGVDAAVEAVTETIDGWISYHESQAELWRSFRASLKNAIDY
jgi:hypothetical protein